MIWILILIFISQVVIAIQNRLLSDQLKAMNDFSELVKAGHDLSEKTKDLQAALDAQANQPQQKDQ